MTLTYTAGPTAWATGPGYGTLRISVPAGWSAPSIVSSNAGYFTVDVIGGTLVGRVVVGMDMKINVEGLPAGTGQIIVAYGDKTFGDPGATAQSVTGAAVFITASTPSGDITTELCPSPQVDVTP